MRDPIVSAVDPDSLQVSVPSDVDNWPNECIDVIEPEKCKEKSSVEVDYLDTPVKSANDKKDYRVIRLPNGLTALLISDVQSISDDQLKSEDVENKDDECTDENENRSKVPKEQGDENGAGDPDNEDVDSLVKHPEKEEKLAGCSLCVGVGSFSDPPEILGMAHFLEHMVFMGSEKYPEENDFDAFTKKHGGFSNAVTGCEYTTFHFEIQEEHLFAALDRFAQFFISPLMKRDAMTREREAVDNEFQGAATSDFCREMNLFHTFAQPGHPATKFSSGNLVTLRDNVADDKLYEELHKFRQRHYSAHRMTLALQARIPMDTLEQYVKDCFSNVPNNGLPPDDFSQFEGRQSFDTSNFKRIYKMKPISDFCKMNVTWTMPSLHHLYKSKPHQYVAWIISHEGKGSLTSYLRRKMWCLNLIGGNAEDGFTHSSMYGLFILSIELTEDGFRHLKDVLDAVFSYISLMRKSGPQIRIYNEIHQTRESNFRFTEEISARGYVKCLSREMHFYPPKDYITGGELYFEYNPIEIQACMDALTPETANILLCDRKFNDAEFDKVEPWCKTKYTDTEIPRDWIEHWRNIEPLPEFHLPEPNIFIADDFSLVPLPEDVPKYPTKVHSDTMCEIWFRPDPKFRIPHVYMYYYFISPLVKTSVKDLVIMDLLIAIVNQLLIEELYPAREATLIYQVYKGSKGNSIGIVVNVSGYSQKSWLLLSKIVRYIAECPDLVTENLFDVIKAKGLKDWYNIALDPLLLNISEGTSIQLFKSWTALDAHAVLSSVKFHHFQTFAKQFFDHIYMQCLVQGNVTKEDVIQNGQGCLDILKCRNLLPKTVPASRVNQMPLGERCCRMKNYNKTDATSVVTNFYQSGFGDIKTSVIVELIIMLMDEPIFNQLRTQEQLGYGVSCLERNLCGILGYFITVCTQAVKFTTEYIDERIEKFLESFLEILKKMSDEELNVVKVALIKLRLCAPLNLYQETKINWKVMEPDEEYNFGTGDKIIAINETKIEDLIDWMEKHVSGGTNFRKLSVQVVGNLQDKDRIENESSEKDSDVTNSDEIEATSKTCDNGITEPRDAYTLESTNNVVPPLEFMVDMPNEKKVKPSTYYITDIEAYKKTLWVYPADNSAVTK